MKTKRLSIKIITFSMLALFLFGGCFNIVYPKRWATMDEVFPPQSIKSQDTQADPKAINRKTFAAPYEDVFRAARVSAAQAQFEIQKSNQDEGIILAVKNIPLPYGHTDRWYILILIKEKGPESTEIISMVKQQVECMVDVAVLGDLISKCEESSIPHWHGGHHLSQFIVFVDNNLIVAGVL